MADINDILSNLNSRYEEVTDLVPDLRVFTDDVSYAENEYGDERDDAPETPEATDNPNGHPNFGAGEVPSITEQVIPVGNPLMS